MRKCSRRFSFFFLLVWLRERAEDVRPTTKELLPELYRPLSSQPKWESRLILPKLVFPNKYAAYTVRKTSFRSKEKRRFLRLCFQRFRNPTRTVQSAYWERVEDHFNQQTNEDKH